MGVGVRIGNGFVDFSKSDFRCPHCTATHEDPKDEYLNRCNKNKYFSTEVKCDSCGKKFTLTYDIKGDAVTYIKATNTGDGDTEHNIK